MEIMPAPGYNPPALPDWLQIPYLVPVVGRDLRLRYDDFINPGIKSGDLIHNSTDDQSEGEEHAVGTLGAIMASGDTYVALTAGHVIKDEVSEMMVQESADNPVISLEVPQPFRRINGRPVMHLSEPSSLRDECGMLLISEDDIHQFNYVIPRLNTHFFETFDSDHENQVPGDPIATSRCEAIKNLVDKEPIIVFKQGAATGLTMGSFERIFDPSAFESKSKNDGDNESEDEEGDIVPTQYDNNEWMGCVRGVNDSLPFTASGDSGALVFAMSQDGITIPLGIHVGTVVENGVLNGCSIFISLEMFCHQALRVGWRLSFIHEDGMLNPAC